MIVDGGTINCSGKCNKINLTMGEYVMNSPMIDENVEAISSDTPMISCNALARISTPQTLKIEGYIKKKKVIVP
jgi:hypothetical protein